MRAVTGQEIVRKEKKCKVGKLAYSEKSRLEIDIRRKVGENIVTAAVRGAGGCSVNCTVKSEKILSCL